MVKNLYQWAFCTISLIGNFINVILSYCYNILFKHHVFKNIIVSSGCIATKLWQNKRGEAEFSNRYEYCDLEQHKFQLYLI